MVLTTLADFIYNIYLVLYYALKIISFVGFLLFDTISNTVRILSWGLHNANVFCSIVYEDNAQTIQNSKAILLGTADFFIHNITKVYRGLCFAVVTFRDAVLAVWTLLGLTVWTVKRALVLIGQAIWLLFTAPYQLLVLLEEQLVRLPRLLLEAAQQTYGQCVTALTDFAHFVAHDVPVEAACGLGLLVLTCFYPAPAKMGLKICGQIAQHCVRFLHRTADQCRQRILSLPSNVGQFLIEAGFYRWIRTLSSRMEFQSMFAEVAALVAYVRHYEEVNPREPSDLRRFLQRMYGHIIGLFVFNSPPREVETREQSVQAPVRSPATQPTIGSCIICEDDDRAVAFVPCGHLCVCKTCARHISYYNPVCPVCRAYIEKKLEVYV